MKKIFLLSLLLALCAISALADGKYMLVVELRNGLMEFYQLTAQPVMTFSNRKAILKSESAEAEYELGDITKYYFLDTENSTNIDKAKSSLSFDYVDGEVAITGVDWAEVYTLDSKRVAHHSAQDGKILINTSNYRQGAYIIRTNKRSFKIMK